MSEESKRVPFADMRAEIATMKGYNHDMMAAPVVIVEALLAAYDGLRQRTETRGLDAVRAERRADPTKPPVAFIRIELGERYEDLAIWNPDLLLADYVVRHQFVHSPGGFQEKLLGVIRAGLADRARAA